MVKFYVIYDLNGMLTMCFIKFQTFEIVDEMLDIENYW